MIHAAMTLHTWLTFCAHRKRIYAYFFLNMCIQHVLMKFVWGRGNPQQKKQNPSMWFVYSNRFFMLYPHIYIPPPLLHRFFFEGGESGSLGSHLASGCVG